jgi:FeS assembly SUF system protein
MEEIKKSEAKQDSTMQAHSIEEIKEEVEKVLRTCYDPEIPVNIMDLGLIYDIKIATNGDVFVVMTLTSPACPVAGILPPEVQQKLKDHPLIHDARVEITFDPPWSPDRMSEEAKLELGFL